MRVNFARLKGDLEELGAIGRTPAGRVSRPSFSDADILHNETPPSVTAKLLDVLAQRSRDLEEGAIVIVEDTRYSDAAPSDRGTRSGPLTQNPESVMSNVKGDPAL